MSTSPEVSRRTVLIGGLLTLGAAALEAGCASDKPKTGDTTPTTGAPTPGAAESPSQAPDLWKPAGDRLSTDKTANLSGEKLVSAFTLNVNTDGIKNADDLGNWLLYRDDSWYSTGIGSELEKKLINSSIGVDDFSAAIAELDSSIERAYYDTPSSNKIRRTMHLNEVFLHGESIGLNDVRKTQFPAFTETRAKESFALTEGTLEVGKPFKGTLVFTKSDNFSETAYADPQNKNLVPEGLPMKSMKTIVQIEGTVLENGDVKIHREVISSEPIA